MARLPIPFGNPTTYPGHSGVDYGQPRGTIFRASGSGVVTRRTYNSRCGNAVWVQYDAMPKGAETGHCHLDNYNDSPPVGTRFGEGAALGRVGNTGNSTGPHLHAEVSGYATTDGYWKWFDPNRVVGGGGGGPISGSQRQVGPNGANGRNDPSTSGPVTQTLPPGTIGDFNGWINGQVVEGNGVWFRGAHSGDFFWSGGFTDKGTHDLADLNPPSTQPHQRVVGPNGANGRKDPSTSGPVTQTLPPGTVGDFDAWTNGQNVEGNNVWFRGLHSGDWFWSGGFTSKSTEGLTFIDLNPPAPSTERTVASPNSANVRSQPYTTAAVVGSVTSGTSVAMNAYTHAEVVQGNDVWFRRASDNNWMWSGGFTSQATEGLSPVSAPEPPNPTGPDNPRGLVEYEPVYPRAVKGLEAPLGFTDCQNPITRTPRTSGYTPPRGTTGVIDRFIVHYTSVTNDQLDYFSHCNSRSVCPTFYLRKDGSTFEMIRPGAKPAATGSEWNWRSIAVEILCETPGPEGKVTDAQLEETAQMIAWLAEFDGMELDGAPVSFKIDREHVISHQEAIPGTECPGEYIQPRMDDIVARARAIYEEKHPNPDPDVVEVPRSVLTEWRETLLRTFHDICAYRN